MNTNFNTVFSASTTHLTTIMVSSITFKKCQITSDVINAPEIWLHFHPLSSPAQD